MHNGRRTRIRGRPPEEDGLSTSLLGTQLTRLRERRRASRDEEAEVARVTHSDYTGRDTHRRITPARRCAARLRGGRTPRLSRHQSDTVRRITDSTGYLSARTTTAPPWRTSLPMRRSNAQRSEQWNPAQGLGALQSLGTARVNREGSPKPAPSPQEGSEASVTDDTCPCREDLNSTVEMWRSRGGQLPRQSGLAPPCFTTPRRVTALQAPKRLKPNQPPMGDFSSSEDEDDRSEAIRLTNQPLVGNYSENETDDAIRRT